MYIYIIIFLIPVSYKLIYTKDPGSSFIKGHRCSLDPQSGVKTEKERAQGFLLLCSLSAVFGI